MDSLVVLVDFVDCMEGVDGEVVEEPSVKPGLLLAEVVQLVQVVEVEEASHFKRFNNKVISALFFIYLLIFNVCYAKTYVMKIESNLLSKQ